VRITQPVEPGTLKPTGDARLDGPADAVAHMRRGGEVLVRPLLMGGGPAPPCRFAQQSPADHALVASVMHCRYAVWDGVFGHALGGLMAQARAAGLRRCDWAGCPCAGGGVLQGQPAVHRWANCACEPLQPVGHRSVQAVRACVEARRDDA
jgi:hypothetical protein